MSYSFSRTDKSFLGRWWWTVDRRMLAAVLALMGIGVMLVAAAGAPVAERIGLPASYFVFHHLLVLVPSLIMLFGLSMLDLKWLRRSAFVVLVGGLIAMVVVLFVGMEIKGAQRWIHLPGFSLQPSEFVKPVFLLIAAWLIALNKEQAGFPGLRLAFGLYGVVLLLLMLQPDMGMSFLVTSCFMALIFFAGLPLRWVLVLIFVASGGLYLIYMFFPHVQSRVDRFLHPENNDTYQIDRSIEAFQNGGLFGTGPGQGVVKLKLPDAHADFIFSVGGEELGLVFVLILIALFAYIFLRGFNRVMESDDLFVMLGAAGLLSMFALQALIHMGSSLGLLPTKGMTLPFVSYGGSSLLSMSMAMGMVLSLTRRQARSGIAKSGLSIRPIGHASLRSKTGS